MRRKKSATSATYLKAQLTIIVGTNNRASRCDVAAEQSNRLSIRRKLPFLSHVLLTIFLISWHLRQHVMDDSRFLLKARICLDIRRNLLENEKGWRRRIIIRKCYHWLLTEPIDNDSKLYNPLCREIEKGGIRVFFTTSPNRLHATRAQKNYAETSERDYDLCCSTRSHISSKKEKVNMKIDTISSRILTNKIPQLVFNPGNSVFIDSHHLHDDNKHFSFQISLIPQRCFGLKGARGRLNVSLRNRASK